MWLILAGMALAVFAASTVVPIPLWTARVLRGRRAQLALPPSLVPGARERLRGSSHALADLLESGRVLEMAIEDLIKAGTEARVARPWLYLQGTLLSGQRDSWANDAANEFEYRSSDATRLAFDWIAAIGALSVSERDRLDRIGTDVEAIRRLILHDAEMPVGSMGRSMRHVAAEVERMTAVAMALRQIERALLAEPSDPYR